MKRIEKSHYEMFVRVRDFGATQRGRFPKASLGGQAFAAVDAAVDDLNQHAAAQYSSRREARGGSSLQTAEGEALVEMLDTISRTAHAVALDTPGVDNRFRVPRRQGRIATINAARAFARDAEPLAKEFVAHGMPSDFVAQLGAAIAGVEQALKQQEAERELHASARASITGALESGLAAIRRLDAIVGNVVGDDAAAMAAWAVARRIARTRRAKPSTAAGPESVTPITPAVGATAPATSGASSTPAVDTTGTAATPPAAPSATIGA